MYKYSTSRIKGEIMAEYNNYPTERADASHSNDELVCFFCKRAVKEIDGKLENHAPDCKFRLKQESK